ncbi:hypothetical protein [Variovorax paradoxus]
MKGRVANNDHAAEVREASGSSRLQQQAAESQKWGQVIRAAGIQPE